MVEARLVYMVNPAEAARHTEKIAMGGIPMPLLRSSPLLLLGFVVVEVLVSCGDAMAAGASN